jgi:hypothetical protein
MHVLSPFLLHRLAEMLSTPKTRKTASVSPNSRGTLKDYLATADAFARLSEQAYRLQRLQTMLDAALPNHLSAGARIANLKLGKVVIHADSGAVAVKLRQLGPRLAEGFNQQGQEVTGIEVRVQARRRPSPAPRGKSPKVIGERPKQALTSLAAGLTDDSPVKRALEKLLKNT